MNEVDATPNISASAALAVHDGARRIFEAAHALQPRCSSRAEEGWVHALLSIASALEWQAGAMDRTAAFELAIGPEQPLGPPLEWDLQFPDRVGPHAAPCPKVLPPRTCISPEHVQELWSKVKLGKEHLPSLKDCGNIGSQASLTLSIRHGHANKRTPPTPIADALGTLQAAVPEAVESWRKRMELYPGQKGTPIAALARLEALRATLHAMPLDWLGETPTTIHEIAWESTVCTLYKATVTAWVHAGNALGKPHPKDRVCLFLYKLLTAVGLEKGRPGGCKSPGAISEFLRASIKRRRLPCKEEVLERIAATDRWLEEARLHLLNQLDDSEIEGTDS